MTIFEVTVVKQASILGRFTPLRRYPWWWKETEMELQYNYRERSAGIPKRFETGSLLANKSWLSVPSVVRHIIDSSSSTVVHRVDNWAKTTQDPWVLRLFRNKKYPESFSMEKGEI